MPNDILDAANAAFAGNFTSAPARITANANSQATTLLSAGYYEAVSNAQAYILQGPAGVVANVNTHILPAGVVRNFYVSGTTDGYLAAIVDSGAAAICVTKKGPV